MTELNVIVYIKDENTVSCEQLKAFHNEIKMLMLNNKGIYLDELAAHYFAKDTEQHIENACIDTVLPMKFMELFKNSRFHLFINTDGSVAAVNRLLKRITKEYYPQLDVVMLAEGDEYINTDDAGVFFPEKYLVEMYGSPKFETGYSRKNYFRNFGQVLAFLDKISGEETESIKKTLEDLVEKYGGSIALREFKRI